MTQVGDDPSTYTVSGASNRLSSISGALTRTYGYDAAGNITSDGAATFTYNDAGRLVSAAKAGVTSTYSMNGLGQRVRKTTGGVSTYFVYDEAGHLAGEYDDAGDLIQETIWFGDTLVAVLKPNSASVDVFYIHADHLNTPRRISRPTDNTVVWRWDSDPFGTTAANEDPDADSVSFAYNLRFPGQYYDSETGTHYNGFRDYDSQTGRYPQSDPIGLAGGLNTYAYVGGNPLSNIDPLGLAWGSTDFVDHWYGGSGAAVDLGNVGLLNDFTGHSSVQAASAAAGRQISQQADSAARSLMGRCQCAGDFLTTSFNARGRGSYDVTGSTPLNSLFSVGRGVLVGNGDCFAYVDCLRKKYRWTCKVMNSVRDRFTDPGRIDKYGINVRVQGGVDYDITARWEGDFLSGGN